MTWTDSFKNKRVCLKVCLVVNKRQSFIFLSRSYLPKQMPSNEKLRVKSKDRVILLHKNITEGSGIVFNEMLWFIFNCNFQ